MPIAFACPCGRSYTVPDDRAGQWTRCAGCREKIQVPAAPAADPDDGGFEVVDEAVAPAEPPISFRCGCGQPLEVAAEFAGQQVECPTCEKVVTAPAATPTLAKRATRPAAPEPADDEAAPAGGRFGKMRERQAAKEAKRAAKAARGGGSAERDEKKAIADLYMADARRKQRADAEREATRHRGGGFAVSGGMVGGGLAMLIAVVWFVGGAALGVWFIYPPILFILGLIGFVKGMFGADD